MYGWGDNLTHCLGLAVRALVMMLVFLLSIHLFIMLQDAPQYVATPMVLPHFLDKHVRIWPLVEDKN